MLKKKNPRYIRKIRIRKKVIGTVERPRLCVFRSTKHISAQAIDDSSGKTLASVSTVDKKLKIEGAGNKKGAEKIGELIAEKLREKGINKVVFDRNGYIYHGRVQALAEGARKQGLIF
ncbi:MAG: 50S ribosomal protein L18 [Nitrospinae bacterium]|nr:50S ribosomal protein L18 [Nitrospinota bacterium]